MKKMNLILLSLITCMSCLSLQTEAKDLTHRLGVGFKNNTTESVPSLTAVYYADKNYAFTSSLGFDTKKDYNTLQASAGVRKMIYFEPNLNFYMSGQVGIVNAESPTDGKNTGLEFLASVGSEFFFNGLENLGFTAEAGLGLSTVKNTRFRTVADDPFRAGVVFYF